MGVRFMNSYKEIESSISNAVELSSVCRGTWCRTLESDIDNLDSEFYDFEKSEKVNDRFCHRIISEEIRSGYRNIKPSIRVLNN